MIDLEETIPSRLETLGTPLSVEEARCLRRTGGLRPNRSSRFGCALSAPELAVLLNCAADAPTWETR